MTETPFETLDTLITSLRERGFRLTPQRQTILEIFFNLPEGQHLSAEELQAMLVQAQSDISLATSYRTLKLLATLGVLRELDFAEDHKHYELCRDGNAPHQHIICVECGATEEFFAQDVIDRAAQVVTERGVKLIDTQLKIFVLCQDCSTGLPGLV